MEPQLDQRVTYVDDPGWGWTLALLSPMVLVLASLVASAFWPRSNPVGIEFSVVGLLLGGFNFYLAFVRPKLYRRRPSMEGYRYVSGIPAIGTFCVAVGNVVGFADWIAATVGLFALAVDVDGTPWVIIHDYRHGTSGVE